MFDRISGQHYNTNVCYLDMRQTRHKLDQALEHRHVTDGDQLLPDVEDDLQEGGGVLIPKIAILLLCPNSQCHLLSQFDVGHSLVLLVRTQKCMEVIRVEELVILCD